MFRHLLVPTDGSPASVHAIEASVNLAKSLGARITFLTVSKPWKIFSLDPLVVADTDERKYLEDSARLAALRLKVGEDLAKAKGVTAAAIHMYEEHPWKAIIDEATRLDCDVISMASHGHKGTVGFVLGSETVKVLTHAKIPVLMMR
jgi:nucleotide-binding universal stress UspA family protein